MYAYLIRQICTEIYR